MESSCEVCKEPGNCFDLFVVCEYAQSNRPWFICFKCLRIPKIIEALEKNQARVFELKEMQDWH